MAPSRWLVTGAGGQLGSACADLAAAHRVDLVPFRYRMVEVVEDPALFKDVLQKELPQVVLNTAAVTAVDQCEVEKDLARSVNETGAEIVARACKGGPLLVHMSTDYVFDGKSTRPIPEDAPTGPLSVYGVTKLAGEQAVRSVGGDQLIVRTQWLYGNGANFVRTILRAAQKGESLRVVEDQIGRPTWTHSLAYAIFEAVNAGARGTLHLANEGIASWFDFAREIVAEGAVRGQCPNVEVVPIPTSQMPRPATRPAYGVLGLEKARSLGIHLPHWRAALGEYLDA